MTLGDLQRDDFDKALAWAEGKSAEELTAFAQIPGGPSRWQVLSSGDLYPVKALAAAAARLKGLEPRASDIRTDLAKSAAEAAGLNVVDGFMANRPIRTG